MYDYSKLKGRITEVFGSRKEFALYLGKTDSYVSKVLNNKIKFTQENIDIWADALRIDYKEIGKYFFRKKGASDEGDN